MNITRRNILRTSAWTVPVATIASAAPAFATSTPACTAIGHYKEPGKGKATKDYYVKTSCVGTGEILSVDIYDDVKKVWRRAVRDQATDYWCAKGFNDSRNTRLVRVTVEGPTTYDVNVSFHPWEPK